MKIEIEELRNDSELLECVSSCLLELKGNNVRKQEEELTFKEENLQKRREKNEMGKCVKTWRAIA